MAQIAATDSEKIYKISRWRGVNEAQEGEASLKNGEAAEMKNFRVTAGGALRKRPGSMNAAGLMNAYNVVVDTGDPVTLLTETGASTASLSMQPNATTDTVGTPIGSGTAVTVTGSSATTYEDYYYTKDGALYKFDELALTARAAGTQTTFRYSAGLPYSSGFRIYFCQYDSVLWDGESWTGTGAAVVNYPNSQIGVGKYLIADGSNSPAAIFAVSAPAVADFEALYGTQGRFFKYVSTGSESYADLYANPWWKYYFDVTPYTEAKYEWKFHGTSSEPNDPTNSTVRGLWSGFVGGDEVLCAACNGYLWELSLNNGVWSKTSCGAITTTSDVFMFGFDEKLYILNGTQYKVWDGTTLSDVTGYRPLVSVSVVPTGGGTSLEQVNKLNGLRRCRFSPDGSATVFQLPETGLTSIDYVINSATGAALTGWTGNTTNGTVTFTTAPGEGTNTIEVGWTYPTNGAAAVKAMRYAEIYNGTQDSRVFIYGDGSNKCFYSGLDYNGQPRADYFPDLNECAVGDSNTPLTALIRHYGRLLAFKLDSAFSISYGAISLEDGSSTAGFYVTPVNRSVGNCAPGQAVLVENKPRTLDGRSVIEWKSTSSSGNITGDERNAQRISQRVDSTIRSFDLDTAKCFYDKLSNEYYVIGSDGKALVNGIDSDSWYVYTDVDAVCLINYKDELYFGTTDGYLRHFSDDYKSDNGAAIDAHWESGAMDFGEDFKRKYSAMVWVGVKPEDGGYLSVTAQTDRNSALATYSFESATSGEVPEMVRLKLKAKSFTYYKLILDNDTADKTVTVVSADVRIRGTGYVR